MTMKRLVALGLTVPLLLATACSASDYVRVDRTGQPAVATALLRGGGQPIREGVPVNAGADNERDSFNRVIRKMTQGLPGPSWTP